jgi:hypothetical protein
MNSNEFVTKYFPFASGNDGDFSEDALIAKHNDELLEYMIKEEKKKIEKLNTKDQGK